MQLKGKTAVVTGSSYGLGKSISETLLENGTKVYGLSRTDPKITNPNFVWIKCDLTSEIDIASITTDIQENVVDVLINNAGIVVLEKTLEFSDDSFDNTFELNFKAPIKIVLTLKNKLENALILNISSTSDRFAESNYGLYSASKAALNIFFETVAKENSGMKMINLLPSYMDTPLQRKLVDRDKFDWKLAMSTRDVSETILSIIENQDSYDSGSKIMIVNNKTSDDTEDPEKLWYYNVDTKKIKKLK